MKPNSLSTTDVFFSGFCFQCSKKERGSVLVEFAIVLPLLLIILFGIIEFGLLMYNKQVLTNAAREGARYGVVVKANNYLDSDVIGRVKDYSGEHLITFGNDTTIDDPIVMAVDSNNNEISISDACFGDSLIVDFSYSYTFLVLPALLPAEWETININSRAKMRYEKGCSNKN